MIDLREKKILVTGGAGFVGRHLINYLVNRRNVPSANIRAPRSVELDLRIKENAREAVSGVDVVIHLAALSGGIGFSSKHPGQMFYDNAAMGLNLVEASRLEGVEKFVNIGSYNEYPATAPMPLREDDLWSGLPNNSFLAYGMAKKTIALQLQVYREEYGFNGIHLIMASMYGPGYAVDSTTLVPSFIRQIKASIDSGSPVVGWGAGNATRDFLYVEDAAEGIVLATEKYDEASPVNLGSGKEVGVKELLTSLCGLMGYRGEIKWDITKPEGQLRYILNISQAKTKFDYKPISTLIEGLEKTVEYSRKI